MGENMVSKVMAVRIRMERNEKDGHIPLFAIIINHLKHLGRSIGDFFKFPLKRGERGNSPRCPDGTRWNEIEEKWKVATEDFPVYYSGA